jgi:hypothetical protein
MFTEDQVVIMFNGPETFCDSLKDTENFRNYGLSTCLRPVSRTVFLSNPGTQGSVHTAQ